MITMTASLASQIDELERLGKTRDDALQVPREEGELLAAIALSLHCTNHCGGRYQLRIQWPMVGSRPGSYRRPSPYD